MKRIIVIILMTVINIFCAENIDNSQENLYKDIILAAGNGHKDEVAQLINDHANVNAKDDKGYTALIRASLRGYEDIAKLLIDAGANINEENQNGDTPLTCAIKHDHVGMVELLLSKGAKVNIRAFMLANIVSYKDKFLELLRSYIDQKDQYGRTALMNASNNSNSSAVEILIKNGAKVNEQDKRGFTALILACGHEDKYIDIYCDIYKYIVELLINNGADVNEKSSDGYTPLMFAAYNGYEDIVKLLIAAGANINAEDKCGNTAIMWAYKNNQKNIVNLLTQFGAKI